MQYEITFIVTDEKNTKIIKGALEKNGARIVYEEEIGRKTFVYPIKKEDAGFYFTTYFEIDPQKISTITDDLTPNTNILRFLILKSERDLKTIKTRRPRPEREKITKKEKVSVEQIQQAKPKKIQDQVIKKQKKDVKVTKGKTVKRETQKKTTKTIKKLQKKIEPIRKKIIKKEVTREEKKPSDEQERMKKLEEKLDELLKE